MEKKLSSISENMRRNFTANVSHELKTPITSISGYAEMMMTGLARSEDLPLLAEKIYTEAQRLIALCVTFADLADGVGFALSGSGPRGPRLGALRQRNLLRDINQLATGEALAKITTGDIRQLMGLIKDIDIGIRDQLGKAGILDHHIGEE